MVHIVDRNQVYDLTTLQSPCSSVVAEVMGSTSVEDLKIFFVSSLRQVNLTYIFLDHH